jgi:hypothetical protein
MDRRHFIKTSGVLCASVSASPVVQANDNNNTSISSFVLELIKENDRLATELEQRIIKNPNNRWFGGLKDGYGIPTAGGTSRWIEALACAFTSKKSSFYQSDKLITLLDSASQYMLSAQHKDGTIDLLTTNFQSPPDTGFVMEHICPSFDILQKSRNSDLTDVLTKLKEFMLNAANALTVGGIHTPNHRWVVCRALARTNRLFPNEKYLNRINQWLGEGIDIDPDGQYTEKSSSVYTPLTNRCLLTMAQLLNRPELYGHVRKNLDMTLYYVHPDGEVVTEASKRQDQYRRGSMAPYYIPYRTMALLDNDGQFAAMSNWIQRTSGKKLVSWLINFMENPLLNKTLPPEKPLPTEYTKVFAHSKLARVRHQDKSATILADNFSFFSFHKGDAAIEAIRFASAFFGKAQFSSPELLVEKNTFVLKQKLSAPYYQPFPTDQIPKDGDWNKMARSLRPQSEIQHYLAIITVKKDDNEFELNFDVTGSDNIPVAIEIGFRKGGTLDGVKPVKELKNAFLFHEKKLVYKFKDNSITITPGKVQHTWTQIRGAKPKLNSDSVYITGFTPFNYTLKIS